MPNLRLADLTAEIENNVRRALLEDVGSGDITAQLIPAERLAKATIITRDDAVSGSKPISHCSIWKARLAHC
jgi:nicotinate-nucleotide pyrophosphorylase (carboxylating)